MDSGLGTDLNVVDRFLTAFTSYIDSGFGLLQGDVHFLTATLIALDITIAGLWWAMDGEADILSRFIKKVLYVGAFALIIGNFNTLATIIYKSFSQLGIDASGGNITAAKLMQPGAIAGTGFTAAWPMIEQIKTVVALTPAAIANVLMLLVAWLLVVLSFFILAVQVFVTIVEFKLTSLAGFVLVPFALWNRSSFLAERVLGNVISSGIKVMVLALIIGMGTTFFDTLAHSLAGKASDTGMVMAMVLAALSMLGLGIFGPGIASGLVSGAPQLGAGAAVGTIAGAAIMTGGTAMLSARAAMATGSGGIAALRAGTAMGSAASTAYKLGQAGAGSSAGGPGIGAGLSGVASAARSYAGQKMRAAAASVRQDLQAEADKGRAAVWQAKNMKAVMPGGGVKGSDGPASATGKSDGAATASDVTAPAWARKLHARQTAGHQRQAAIQAIKEGDRPGAPANPDLSEKE